MSVVLLWLVVKIIAVVAIMALCAGVFIFDRTQVSAALDNVRSRFGAVWPYLVGLVIVIPLSGAIRQVGTQFSWVVGWNVTGAIYAFEHEFVAAVQQLASPVLTAVFSFVYLYGYVFLLVFPFFAYFLLDSDRYFKELSVAYATNYLVGVLLYTLIIAYGPRNVMPTQVEPLLYTMYPETHVLTSKLNTNTNVFPSLHTSLSVTVALFAYRTRDEYPRWLVVALALAAAVVCSTVYLGIHWGTDVLAGIGLALLTVQFAKWAVDRVGSTGDDESRIRERTAESSVFGGYR